MQKIRVLIVEDEWIVSEEVKELLERKGYVVQGQAEDAASALEILSEKEVDVALLDINIKGDKDGIELAHDIIRKHQCALIFLTAFDDEIFLNRAKAVKPAAYIVKPYEERNLQAAIEIAFNNLAESEVEPKENSYFVSDHIFIRDQSRFKKIALEKILFVEAVGSYTDIYTDDGKSTLAVNLKTFEENLDSPKFLRTHRSYLVNLSKVDEYEGNRVFVGGKPIPISSSHKEEVMKRFKFI